MLKEPNCLVIQVNKQINQKKKSDIVLEQFPNPNSKSEKNAFQ